MRQELGRYFRMPLYWQIPCCSLTLRAVTALLDRRCRAEQFWDLAGKYWSFSGSVTAILLVLLVLIRPFSLDWETGCTPVMSSTPLGRGRLLGMRILAGCTGSLLVTGMLGGGNLTLSLFLGQGVSRPESWAESYLDSCLQAAAGTAAFFLLSALVCDMTRNQPAAAGICGGPMILSYQINFNTPLFVTQEAFLHPDAWWLLRYGWFTPLMRGRLFEHVPWFFPLWYGILLGGAGLLVLHVRKERKEL